MIGNPLGRWNRTDSNVLGLSTRTYGAFSYCICGACCGAASLGCAVRFSELLDWPLADSSLPALWGVSCFTMRQLPHPTLQFHA